MTGGGAVVFDYDYELRCDSNISESDLPRIQKEINHKLKKQEKEKRNLAAGLRADG